tara:strand:- start:5846 stop:6013 length:168 start_codon:yes stop_codon:yes gene_type:complete
MSKEGLLLIENWLDKSAQQSGTNLALEIHGSIGFWSEMARLDLITELKAFIEDNV